MPNTFGLGRSFSIQGILANAGLLISNVPCRLENLIITTTSGTGSNRHLCLFDSAAIVAPATAIPFCIRLPSASNPSANYKWDVEAPFQFSVGLFIAVSTVDTNLTLVGSSSVQYNIKYRLLTI